MTYQEKLLMLDGEDFFTLFLKLQAEPRWVTSAGKRAIQVLGKCHHSIHHSALFDPTTLKVNCFSLCGGGMFLHTWVQKALELEDPQDGREFIESWIDNQDIDFTNRVPSGELDFTYQERPYAPTTIEKVQGIPTDTLNKYWARFDDSAATLNNLVWHTEDGISTEILKEYEVAYYPDHKSIILPHHNIDGEIVGLYERSFRELRKDARKKYPDMPFKTDIMMKDKSGKLVRQAQLIDYPRAKYVPLLRDIEDRETDKSSWSFSNTRNLYGLHLAKDEIKKTGIAIIFEGGKSVMLAHQFGCINSVATHTFGASLSHISMLIAAGAKEIVLAFDKQYKDMVGQEWDLYEHKTRALAEKIKGFVEVSRVIDTEDEILDFKDSPIDKGREVFEKLYMNREYLTGDKVKPKAAKIIEEPRNIVELLRQDFNQNKMSENKKVYDILAAKIAEAIKQKTTEEGKVCVN